jgi:hypothetical protein
MRPTIRRFGSAMLPNGSQSRLETSPQGSRKAIVLSPAPEALKFPHQGDAVLRTETALSAGTIREPNRFA